MAIINHMDLIIDRDHIFYSKDIWEYFLPQPDVPQLGWVSYFYFISLLQLKIPPGIIMAASHNILLLVAFFVSRRIYNSIYFSATVTIFLLFSPFNYHTHAVPGTTFLSLYVATLLACLYYLLEIVSSQRKRSWIYFTIWTSLLASAYPSWLDLVVVNTLLFIPISCILKKHGHNSSAKNYSIASILILALALLYLIIYKYSMSHTALQGTEAELIFYYRRLPPMIDDFICNILTYFYTSVAMLLPPEITSSFSLYRGYKPEWLIQQQNGYHLSMQVLTYMNHVFLWRFAAGALFAIFIGFWGLMWKKAYTEYRWYWFFALACFTMVLFGSATPSIVKYRPMHSMPLLGYHSLVGILGTCGLYALLVTWCIHKVAKVKIVLSLFWGYIVYLGLAVPSALATYASVLNMGYYPEPLGRLLKVLQKLKAYGGF